MVEGFCQTGNYSYKIKLVHPSEPLLDVEKEFVSEFEPLVCWGYNRFYKISEIENDNYFHSGTNLLFHFEVKPNNLIQKIQDQQNYIKFLEKKLKNNKIDNQQIKNQQREQVIEGAGGDRSIQEDLDGHFLL